MARLRRGARRGRRGEVACACSVDQSVQAEGPVGLTEPLTTVRRRFCLPSTLAHRGGLEPALGANLLGTMVDGCRP